MVIKIDINEILPKFNPSVACIGFFDGVHLGHKALIDETLFKANLKGIEASLICFEPDPLDLINHSKNKHILSYKDRINKIEEYGINNIYVFKFDEYLMNLNSSLFIKNYLNKINIKELICGFDFTFGYKAKGNTKLLKKEGNFNTTIIPEKKYYKHKISSTRIKENIYNGNIILTNKLLGYKYYAYFKVIECNKNKNIYHIKTKVIDKQIILPKNLSKDNEYYEFYIDYKVKINDIIKYKFTGYE